MPCPTCRGSTIRGWAERYRHHYVAKQHELTLFSGTLEMLHALKARGHGSAWPPAKSRRGLTRR